MRTNPQQRNHRDPTTLACWSHNTTRNQGLHKISDSNLTMLDSYMPHGHVREATNCLAHEAIERSIKRVTHRPEIGILGVL